MITRYNTYNESLRDKMTPKSEEDIKKDVGKLKPEDQLIQASMGGSLSLVKDAIKSGVKKDEYALVNASINGHTDIVEYLIDDAGYDVHYHDDLPLRYAIANGRMEVVKVLLDRGADIHFHNENPLNTAISHSYWDIANYLIKRGADVEKLEDSLRLSNHRISYDELIKFKSEYMTESVKDKMTPVDIQPIIKKIQKMSFLEKIEFIDQKDCADLFDFQELVDEFNRQKKSVKQDIIFYGASVDLIRISTYGVYQGDDDDYNFNFIVMLNRLFRKNDVANESLRDYLTPKSEEEIKSALSGSTLRRRNERLMDACRDGDFDTVKFLITSGALVNSEKWADTSLTVAIRFNHMKIVKFLIKNGANVNRMNRYGETPLVSAVENGKIRMVFLLVESGARLRSVSSRFVEPLWVAVKCGYPDIVKYLIEKGANTSIINPHTGSLIKTAQYFRECYSDKRKEYNEIIKILNDSSKRKINESVRDFLKPKPKDEIKEILDKLPERERLVKGIKMEVYDEKDVDEMLGGLSPREYFIRSMLIEKGLPIEKRKFHEKSMSLIKPYKKVRIGDLLTVPPELEYSQGINDYQPQPLLEIVQKITFFNREEFQRFIKEHQETTSHDVKSDTYIRHLYQTNSWKKINCVVAVSKNRNRYGSFERKKNTFIIYDYGKTTGVFKYTDKEIEEYEKGQ